MASMHSHRELKLKEFEDTIFKIEEEHFHFKDVILDKIKLEKKNLLSNLIYKIDDSKKDVFELAIFLQSIGLNQFFETLKLELKTVDEKQGFINDFNIDENEKEQSELEQKIKDIQELIKNKQKVHDNYPYDIVNLFKIIFAENDITDQESILKLKEKNAKYYIFNKKRKSQIIAIQEYYNSYSEKNLITDGFNLFEEYTLFSDISDYIDEKNVDIFRLKDNLKSIKAEKEFFLRDLEEMRLLNSFEKVKSRTISKFISLASSINNLDYYINKIVEHYQDKENFKKLYLLQLKEKYFNELIVYFENAENLIYEEIKYVEHVFKHMEFCRYKKIDLPYFSNIGYFENRLFMYKKSKLEFFNLFISDLQIDTDDFSIFFEKFKNNLKNILLKEILEKNTYFKLFIDDEVKKLEKEKDAIILKYKV